MDESKIPVEEPADPLAGWKTLSSLIISAVISFGCCPAKEMIFYTLLLFFPIKRILDGILDNNLRKVISGVLVLAVYPVLLNSLPLMNAKTAAFFSGRKLSPAEFKTAVGALFSGIFIIVLILSSLTEKALPDWKIPKKLHSFCSAAIMVFALVIGLLFLYLGLKYCDGTVLRFPALLNILLPVFIAVIGIAAGYRIIRQVLNPAAKESASDQQLAIRPETKLSDVAGMAEVKEQIRLRLIEPVLHPGQAKKYGLKVGGGVLLYGPPGTGKTFLARAVAGELNLPFYMITAADIFGKYVGESEKNIRNLFQDARKNPLSVIFVDELETIFSKRTDNIHETTQKVISYILQELDGVDQKKNPILLLGATNTPWKIDEAFLRPGRFDILAFVDLPDPPARMQILRSAFKQSSLAHEDGLLQYITENTEGWSGADLNGLFSKMSQKAFQTKARVFTKMLAYETMLNNPPAANQELLRQIRQWEAGRKGLA